MAIGDFNANLLKHSIFGSEVMKFCNENDYILSDQSKLPTQTYTFHSDVHDSVSWLYHAVCSVSMYQIIDQISVLYQYLTSDNFTLSLCLNVPQSVVKVQASDDVCMGASLQKIDWGQLPVDIISNYMHMTDALLSDLVLPDDVVTCSGVQWANQCHVNMISNAYECIMNCLQRADEMCIPRKNKKHFTTVPVWN